MVLVGNVMSETKSLRSHVKIQIILMAATHFRAANKAN